MFVFYMAALLTVLAISVACLSAASSGFFTFSQRVKVPPLDNEGLKSIHVDYKVWGGVFQRGWATADL